MDQTQSFAIALKGGSLRVVCCDPNENPPYSFNRWDYVGLLSPDQLLQYMQRNKDEILQVTSLVLLRMPSTIPAVLLEFATVLPNVTTLQMNFWDTIHTGTVEDLDKYMGAFAFDDRGLPRITKLVITDVFDELSDTIATKIFNKIGEIKSLKSLVLKNWWKFWFVDMPALTSAIGSLPLLQELKITGWALILQNQSPRYFVPLLDYLDRKTNTIMADLNFGPAPDTPENLWRLEMVDKEKIKSANFYATVNRAMMNSDGPVEALIELQDQFECFHYVLSELLPPHAFCFHCPARPPKVVSWSNTISHPPDNGVGVELVLSPTPPSTTLAPMASCSNLISHPRDNSVQLVLPPSPIPTLTPNPDEGGQQHRPNIAEPQPNGDVHGETIADGEAQEVPWSHIISDLCVSLMLFVFLLTEIKKFASAVLSDVPYS